MADGRATAPNAALGAELRAMLAAALEQEERLRRALDAAIAQRERRRDASG